MIKILLTLLLALPTLVSAQSVDILWHGEGYTPPFYQGASLWGKQVELNLVAIPQGLGASANLNYRWTRNGTVLGQVSGVGRNTLTFLDTVFSKPQTVSVEIVSSSDEVLASASTNVLPVDQQILIYENSPLYGVLFHREVGSEYPIREGEITLEAIPLFFGVERRVDDLLSLSWRASGAASESGVRAVYRAPTGSSGSSVVEMSASHSWFIMQSASRNLRLRF